MLLMIVPINSPGLYNPKSIIKILYTLYLNFKDRSGVITRRRLHILTGFNPQGMDFISLQELPFFSVAATIITCLPLGQPNQQKLFSYDIIILWFSLFKGVLRQYVIQLRNTRNLMVVCAHVSNTYRYHQCTRTVCMPVYTIWLYLSLHNTWK